MVEPPLAPAAAEVAETIPDGGGMLEVGVRLDWGDWAVAVEAPDEASSVLLRITPPKRQPQ